MTEQKTPVPAFTWSQSARHMGQLQRGDHTWEVYLEFAPEEGGLMRGRVHFVQGDRHRESAWIFLDRTDRDVLSRFNEFGAPELWQLLEALAP